MSSSVHYVPAVRTLPILQSHNILNVMHHNVGREACDMAYAYELLPRRLKSPDGKDNPRLALIILPSNFYILAIDKRTHVISPLKTVEAEEPNTQ
jgi:hypothetical protein